MNKIMIFCLISIVSISVIASQNAKRRVSNSKEKSAQISLSRSNEIAIPRKAEQRTKQESPSRSPEEKFSPNVYCNSVCYCAWWENSPTSTASYR